MGVQIKQTPDALLEGFAYINLKVILKAKHYSQKDLSRETGISEQAISNMANNPTQIKLHSIYLICEVLDIEVSDLIKIEHNY